MRRATCPTSWRPSSTSTGTTYPQDWDGRPSSRSKANRWCPCSTTTASSGRRCSGSTKATRRCASASGSSCATIPPPGSCTTWRPIAPSCTTSPRSIPSASPTWRAQYDAWAERCGVIPREKIVALMSSQGVTRAFWEKTGVGPVKACRGRVLRPQPGRSGNARARPSTQPEVASALRRRRARRRLVVDRRCAMPHDFTMGNDGADAVAAMAKARRAACRSARFSIAPTTVTNRAFGDFVRATRYVTEAERWAVLRLLSAGAGRAAHGSARQVGGGHAVVAAGRAMRRGSGRKGRARTSTSGRTIPSCMSPGMTRRPIAPGPARACRPRPNGNAPRAAAWKAGASPGATTLMQDGVPRCNVWRGAFPNAPEHGWQPAPVPAADGRAQRLRPLQRLRQCVGVVRRLVQPRLSPGDGSERSAIQPAHGPPIDARRLVPLPRLLLQPLSRRRPQLEHARKLVKQSGFRVAR